MLKIDLTREARSGKEAFAGFDIAGYSKKTFGMFAGEEETVTLCLEERLTGVVVDRFGTEAAMRKKDEDHILARVNVAVSRQFFGWVAGLGAGIKIEAPETVAEQYRAYLEDILNLYHT